MENRHALAKAGRVDLRGGLLRSYCDHPCGRFGPRRGYFPAASRAFFCFNSVARSAAVTSPRWNINDSRHFIQ